MNLTWSRVRPPGRSKGETNGHSLLSDCGHSVWYIQMKSCCCLSTTKAVAPNHVLVAHTRCWKVGVFVFMEFFSHHSYRNDSFTAPVVLKQQQLSTTAFALLRATHLRGNARSVSWILARWSWRSLWVWIILNDLWLWTEQPECYMVVRRIGRTQGRRTHLWEMECGAGLACMPKWTFN